MPGSHFTLRQRLSEKKPLRGLYIPVEIHVLIHPKIAAGCTFTTLLTLAFSGLAQIIPLNQSLQLSDSSRYSKGDWAMEQIPPPGIKNWKEKGGQEKILSSYLPGN